MREEDLYELAKEELNSRDRKADLWARACALATDDVDEARYLYTNLRVEELALEHEIDLTSAQSVPPEELTALSLANFNDQAGEEIGNDALDDDPTSHLAIDAPTLAGRIANQDDESNLTPAQLALKRVSENMPEVASPADATAAGTDTHQFTDSPEHTETAQDSQQAIPSLDAEKVKTPATMVLGDLTKDPGVEVDNTIQIDAETSLAARTGIEAASSSDTALEIDDVSSANPDLASSNAFFSDATLSGSDKADTEQAFALPDASSSPETPVNQTNLVSEPGSDDDESKAGAVGAVGVAAAAAAAAVSGKSLSGEVEAGEAQAVNRESINTSDATLQLDSPVLDSPSGTGMGMKSPASSTRSSFKAEHEKDYEDLQELTGVDQATVDAAEAEAAALARQAEVDEAASASLSADDPVEANDAIGDAGGRNREYAIYQHPNGVVNAVPKGNNLKAMLLTLPWLLSRRLWGHSIVYCLLWVVLAVSLLACTSLIMRQWPTVEPVDLIVTGLFALLALVGLFLLPYKFANRWQEDKVSAKGFSYHSDRLATNTAAAEQSFLLDPRNRIPILPDDAEYAGAA